MPTVYSQQTKPWSMMRIGNSIYFVGGSGCAILALNNGLRSYGVCDETPDITVDWLNKHNGFNADGEIYWSAINKKYPGVVKFLEMMESNLYDPDHNRVPIGTEIEKIIAHIAAGHMVILQVDLSPRNGINQGDHYVVIPKRPGLEALANNDWLIQDGWYGKETTLCSPSGIGDGFQGYGIPSKSIYGFVAYEINTGIPPTPTPVRDFAAEKKNALALQKVIYSAFAPYDIARAYAGGHWSILVNAVTYYGYTNIDIKNWLYSLTHKKVVLNNWDLTKSKK